VLQCVAGCCRVLQGGVTHVAGCCRVLQCSIFAVNSSFYMHTTPHKCVQGQIHIRDMACSWNQAVISAFSRASVCTCVRLRVCV